ncbi:Isoepoxydon dehydrogenase patN [Fulvia fulva]|nr:Isoepoxydon dehydrogenase patN [Fulvia fulva]WPV33622.1 Isoepoxydon dehydrogenase patN [Fulvia fulva]
MYLGLDKKVVLVTGGTKGIGRSIVQSFLREGATVHFCSRTKADVEAAGEKYAKAFPDAKAIGSVVDVSSQNQIMSWVEGVAKESSRIDVVVANVSALSIGQDTLEFWNNAYATDMMGTYHLIQQALPHLEKTKGNIISINSVSGRDVDMAAPGAYGAMKAALTHYIAQLAHTLAPKGVRANSVSPDNIYIEDGVWGNVERNMPDLFKSQMSLNPMGRMGKPEEIADTVVFVASSKASFMSGSNVLVDGALCTGVQF